MTYDKDGNTVKADVNNWFDYDNKQWANAINVTGATRGTYQSSTVGSLINEDHILAYYVYIPRYKYQLWNAENGLSNEQEIKIEFEKKSTAKSNGTKNTEWLTHPAFTFGTDELNGIWVGKFEMTGTSTVPTVKPNSRSLGNQNIATAFNTIKSMQSDAYGLSNYDSHMIKNMEWGAVAYLSHSKYGKNGEVWINNVSTSEFGPSITGCSATSASASDVVAPACPSGQEYNNKGVSASTTGNITGIYDMSGGVFEHPMGVMLDVSGNPIYSESGFNASTMPDKKYYDTYQTITSQDDFSKGKLGEATREIVKKLSNEDWSTGWYNDISNVPGGDCSWFVRSGIMFSDGDNSLVGVFTFSCSYGSAAEFLGSRVVLTF